MKYSQFQRVETETERKQNERRHRSLNVELKTASSE